MDAKKQAASLAKQLEIAASTVDALTKLIGVF
jgi:hypothetical protein